MSVDQDVRAVAQPLDYLRAVIPRYYPSAGPLVDPLPSPSRSARSATRRQVPRLRGAYLSRDTQPSRHEAAVEFILLGDIVRTLAYVGLLPGQCHEERLCDLGRVLDGRAPMDRTNHRYRR